MDAVLYSHGGDNPINYLEATEMSIERKNEYVVLSCPEFVPDKN